MPVIDLLRRTRSFRLRKGETRASDHKQPNALDFRFNDALILNRDNERRCGLEAAVTSFASSGHSCIGQEFQTARDDQHRQHSPSTSSAATSKTSPHDVSYLRDSEIGLAISSPWESPQSGGNIQDRGRNESDSPGWPTFVQSAFLDNCEDFSEKPRASRRKVFAGLFGKKALVVSPSHRSTQISNKDSFYQYVNHDQKVSQLSPPSTFQDGAYTYRCPPEWEYRFPSSSDMEQPHSDSRIDQLQRKELGPQRKQSWRRTLSRNRRKGRESRCDTNEASNWSLSPIACRSLHIPLEDSIILNDTPSSSTSGGSLLQVEIPTIQMERYSIMFSGLLQPAPSPSLLMRRQSPWAELKLENKIE